MEMNDRQAFSVKSFCETHDISRALLYQLLKAGRGPRIVHLGRKVLITREAAEEWRRSLA